MTSSGDTVQTHSNFDGAGSGIIPYDRDVWMAMAALTATAWWNVLELNFKIFLTFKKRRGLYFWALLVSSWGIVGHSLSLVFKFFTNYSPYWVLTMLMLGWWAMVNGQSLVLYSRLHLVVRKWYVLRGVLWIIVVDGVLVSISTSVLTYGASSNRADLFLIPFRVIEKVQMTVFACQETITSSIYIYFTVQMIQPALDADRRRIRNTMLRLLAINVFIILMDVSNIVVQTLGLYYLEATLKSVIYSVKLKLEFVVLNELMHMSRRAVGKAIPTTDAGVPAHGARARLAGAAGTGDPESSSSGFTCLAVSERIDP